MNADLGAIPRALRAWMIGAVCIVTSSGAHGTSPLMLDRPRHWRIVPIGDSITQGNTNHWTYRYPLWKMLIDGGVDFDFVGSISHFDIVNPAIPPHRGRSFDFDHEGRVFYQTSEIAGQLPGWINGPNGYTPDIALVHAGTNDALLAQPIAGAVANLTSIITTLRVRNPRVHVLLAKLIPTFNPFDSNNTADARVSAINAEIDAIAAAMNSAASRVIVVDHNTGFFANHTLNPPAGGDTYDGVHPSPAGEEKIALRWFAALQLFVAAPMISRDGDGRMAVDFVRVVGNSRLSYLVSVTSLSRNDAVGG